MSDFESVLRAKLDRNAEMAEERQLAEQEMDRAERERLARQAATDQQLTADQRARHGELVDALSAAARGLKAEAPEDFVVRLGWTESGEEFIAKITTRLVTPARSLFVELDRDDDEVLARWHTDVGDSLELWRLLEVSTVLVQQLVLQVADQELWYGAARPPAFPKG